MPPPTIRNRVCCTRGQAKSAAAIVQPWPWAPQPCASLARQRAHAGADGVFIVVAEAVVEARRRADHGLLVGARRGAHHAVTPAALGGVERFVGAPGERGDGLDACTLGRGDADAGRELERLALERRLARLERAAD